MFLILNHTNVTWRESIVYKKKQYSKRKLQSNFGFLFLKSKSQTELVLDHAPPDQTTCLTKASNVLQALAYQTEVLHWKNLLWKRSHRKSHMDALKIKLFVNQKATVKKTPKTIKIYRNSLKLSDNLKKISRIRNRLWTEDVDSTTIKTCWGLKEPVKISLTARAVPKYSRCKAAHSAQPVSNCSFPLQ